ncbi:MAG: hydrogenase formation protein HypD [Pirellulaceae bacterium]|nr:hydrogenase formation protein HypD [Pirellulaceae bacterium]
MKHVDEYRDARTATQLVEKIQRLATRRWTLMEVCGGQTHGILRHGVDQALADAVQLLHGPGCPVCVSPVWAIDQAITLAQRPGTILASFGDMLRVPGTDGSLQQAKSRGAEVRVVYSPLDAVTMARQSPQSQVVFLAVGFETTAPATALAVLQAERLALKNFKVLSVHVRVLPAMEAIASAPHNQVQAFLAAGHVCTVMGHQVYQPFVQRYNMPVVVTGFEPVDLLQGIFECIRMLECGDVDVVNAYPRSVRSAGNENAQRLLDQVFQISDQTWRGMGRIAHGGLVLRPQYAQFDALAQLDQPACTVDVDHGCRSGEVMTGRMRPPQCPHFGLTCTPQQPLGAPMVSSEGACAAYFTYHSPAAVDTTAGSPQPSES